MRPDRLLGCGWRIERFQFGDEFSGEALVAGKAIIVMALRAKVLPTFETLA